MIVRIPIDSENVGLQITQRSVAFAGVELAD